jgi:Aldehyde dehydrogenase family
MPDRSGAKRTAGKQAAKTAAAKPRAASPAVAKPAVTKTAAGKPAATGPAVAKTAAGKAAADKIAAGKAAAGEAAAGEAAAGKAAGNSAGAKSAGAGRADAVVRPGAGVPAGGGSGARLGVRKTYKLFIGGAFPRSESGRSYPVTGPDGGLLAHAALASRKDARDAVTAARAAFGKWSGATAYNRGQVLYRVAELLEGRAAQFADEIVQGEGASALAAARLVSAAIDRWVWYAGWPDKVAQVAGGANPVAGPYFNFTVPEPTGVVAVVAPAQSSLLGLVSVLAPVIATGNAAVVIASEARPLAAITLTEVLATSDVPAGVVNVLTGRTAELAPVLAGHMDVNAIDLTGVGQAARAELERLAADNVKRVFASDEDWAAPADMRRMLAFLETKTVWHPVGI